MATVTVMHEPPSQRRHYRFISPAAVILSGTRYPTSDWGMGGFRIESFDGTVTVGERLNAEFCLNYQGFEISFPAPAEVVRTSPNCLAARFVNLGGRESEVLRHFTSCIASGEIAPVGNLLARIDRPVTPVAAASIAGQEKPARRRTARIVIALSYLAAGVLVAGLLWRVTAGAVFRLGVDTAVISTPLDQIVSQDAGKLAQVFVQPGDAVHAGQPLCRVESDLVVRDVETAREDLEEARIALRNLETRRKQETEKLDVYKTISRNQLELARARVVALTAERDDAKAQFERARKLFQYGVIAAQLFDQRKANLEKYEALLGQALAEQKIAETSIETANRGSFFSGNFLVGDLPMLTSEETAARERVAVAQGALDQRLSRVAQRIYRAPYDAVTARVFKSAGTTVDRGEALVVLRRNDAEPYIDAYLTQAEAMYVNAGAQGTAFIPALNKHYQVRVTSVDRTAGFLKEMQTPRLLQPQYTWRGMDDRSAYAKLTLVDIEPMDFGTITPGLPVHLELPKARDMKFLAPLAVVHAASRQIQNDASAASRLWPAGSPLFSGKVKQISDPRFQSVRQAVLDAAEKVLRLPPAPVEVLHSAAVTDKSDPSFQHSRRAFEDSDHFALLALAWSLTGRRDYRDHARLIVAAWAAANHPTGQPIDETRLDGFLWGLDLVGGAGVDPAVAAWLERWRASAHAWQFGPKTEHNNHKTHHLKILLMLDKLLARDADYRQDLHDAEEHVKVNLANADGSSLDYHERDALHYHVFDLEAWEEIALATGCCRAEVDRAFGFLRTAVLERPGHIEFARSTAPIDRKRAAGGFDYAQPRPYDPRKATRAIFGYATLSGRPVDPELRPFAEQGREPNNLFYEARSYLWQNR